MTFRFIAYPNSGIPGTGFRRGFRRLSQPSKATSARARRLAVRHSTGHRLGLLQEALDACTAAPDGLVVDVEKGYLAA